MESVPENDVRPATKGPAFELIGGHPALDLVNTLDWRFRESGPEDFLTSYNDLVRFVEQSGLLPASRARQLLRSIPEVKAEGVVKAVRELREAAANTLYAAVNGRSPQASSMAQLEGFFKEASGRVQLRWTGSRLAQELPQSTPLPALPLWMLSLSTFEFMTSEEMHLLRECRNPECRWLFMDTSKNHTRRWCDMKICGNRMKARRFKAQHRN